MAVTETPVQVMKVEFACEQPDCTGKMIAMQVVVPSEELLYEHVCNECGYTENMADKYPTLRYDNI